MSPRRISGSPARPGESWDPHTIHTHYFGFSVPEARIGAFIYVRYQPASRFARAASASSAASTTLSPLDMDYLDYEMTMPWPEVDGNTITTANGLRIEFLEPGRGARVTYSSEDGTSFDLIATARDAAARARPRHARRGPRSDARWSPAACEQMMHMQRRAGPARRAPRGRLPRGPRPLLEPAPGGAPGAAQARRSAGRRCTSARPDLQPDRLRAARHRARLEGASTTSPRGRPTHHWAGSARTARPGRSPRAPQRARVPPAAARRRCGRRSRAEEDGRHLPLHG